MEMQKLQKELESYGLSGIKEIFYNLSYDELFNC